MRIRTIKPEFWVSEDIAALDWDTRLIFVGLWSYVDDNGVGRDNEKLIVADLFPLEDDPREALARVSRGLQRLAAAGLIVRYIADGRRYLYVTNWQRHQRIDRPGKPRYPLPTSEDVEKRDNVATLSRDIRETASTGTGEQGNRGTGEQIGSAPPAAPAKPSSSKRRRGTAMTADWLPTEEQRHRLAEQFPTVDLRLEHEKFVDHWLSKGEIRQDWGAAFRNWCRNAAEFQGKRPAARPATTQPTLTPAEMKFARAEALKANPDPRILAAAGIPMPGQPDQTPALNVWTPDAIESATA